MLGENVNATPDGRFNPASTISPGAVATADRQQGYPTEAFLENNNEEGLDLIRYWRILLRHWLVVLAVLIASLGCGLAMLLLTEPIYTASVTLQIDKETAQVVDVRGLEPREVIASEEFFQTQYGLLKSRSLANQTISKLDMSHDAAILQALGIEAKTASGRPVPTTTLNRNLLLRFQRSLNVTPVRGSRLVNITFDSRDPTVSARIANAVAENFISDNLERRWRASSYNREFLQDQLGKEKAKLEASERQLAAYAKAQQIINIPGSPTETGSSSTANQSLTTASLMALNDALAKARGERIRAETRWRQAQASKGDDITDVLDNPTVQMLKKTQSELEAEYQDKLKVFKPEYAEMQPLRARILEVNRRLDAEVRNVQNSLRSQYEISLAGELQFEGQVRQLKNSVLDLRDRSIQYDILQREVDTSRELYDGLLQKFREIGVAGGLANNNIAIIDRAEAPVRPSKPQPLFVMTVALGVGLVLGVLLALMLELLDESIRSPEDVERKVGLSLLGTIPKLEKGTIPIQALADVRSSFSEAYYSVRTALQFSTNEGVPSSILVTSARPSEGKSTSASAIAINFARLGQRVVLIDADLRNPSLHRVFGIENNTGLSNFLTGGMALVQLARTTEFPNLSFVPCGPLPPNPAELLAGNRLQALLLEARKNYDVLIIDGPPVMGLADAPLLASMVSGTVLVVESGGTGRNLAKLAIKRLLVGHARLLGILLTKFDARKTSYGYGYGYAYDYDYGQRPALKGKA